jgi:hypothetical protein
MDLIGGIWLFTQQRQLDQFIAELVSRNISLMGTRLTLQALDAMVVPAIAALVIFGIVELLAAVGIFRHKGWGRALGILTSLLGLLVMIGGVTFSMALAPGTSVPVIGSVAILIGYAFILVALFAGGSHFRRRYPQR